MAAHAVGKWQPRKSVTSRTPSHVCLDAQDRGSSVVFDDLMPTAVIYVCIYVTRSVSELMLYGSALSIASTISQSMFNMMMIYAP